MRKVAPNFNADILKSLLTTADDYITKNTSQRTASIEYDKTGKPLVADIGGNEPFTITPGVVTDIRDLNQTQRPPPQSGAAIPNTSRFVRDEDVPLTDFQKEDIRRIQTEQGLPITPASFTGGNMRASNAGQMPPNMVSGILDSAVNTGVMAQIDLDHIIAMSPPQAKQAIIDIVRSNQITLQADAPSLAASGMGQQQPMASNPVQRPQSQFADMRAQPMQSQTAGLRGAPPMEQTMAQYKVGDSFQGRDTTVSPYPASAQVPIARVREEAVAGRESADEVYTKEKARARAQREALIEAGPKPLTPVQEAKLRDNIAKDYTSARSTISMMLDPVAGVVATVDKVRKLTPAQKEAITGYSGYLPSVTPGSRSADTAIKNLRGKVTEMGKSAAALTGAIGQMAVQEWRIVSDMIASLDIEGMEANDLDDQLDIIESQARRAAEVTRDAYDNQYVEEFARYPGRFELKETSGAPVKKQTSEARLPRVRNNADFNKLKPGTLFMDPNGQTRRKP